MHYLYWIHLEEHTDPFTEGYIGISRQPEIRFRQHTTDTADKAGSQILRQIVRERDSDCLKHTILETLSNQEDARQQERFYRPKPNIGWNLMMGGGVSPDCTNRQLSDETRQKIGSSNRKTKSTRSYVSPFKDVTGRYSEEVRALIGSYHRGKTISEAHRQSAREKNSREKSVRARSVTLRNLETGFEKTFRCVRSASEELDINYSTLRSAMRQNQEIVAKIWKIIDQGQA